MSFLFLFPSGLPVAGIFDRIRTGDAFEACPAELYELANVQVVVGDPSPAVIDPDEDVCRVSPFVSDSPSSHRIEFSRSKKNLPSGR